jgi:methylmalonyl-CoA mutase N-terminal domain/subunit
LETEKRILVGINRYTMEKELLETLKIDATIENKQVEALKELKSSRDNKAVEDALKKLKEALASDANLFPFVLAAVKSYATIGEITNTMKEVFGEYKPVGIY